MRLAKLGQGRWKVLAVVNARGDCPVLELLMESGAPGVRLLADLQERVPQHGPPRNSEASKPLRDKIFEFREPTTHGGTLRILYFYDKGNVVICANGILKKSRKTPDELIDAAVDIKAAYDAATQRNDIEIEELPPAADLEKE